MRPTARPPRPPSERAPREAPAVRDVLCGIDVLARDGFAPLKGKRVGLVTNHTGLTREGVTTIDVLFKAPGVKLVALFSPEHGIRGAGRHDGRRQPRRGDRPAHLQPLRQDPEAEPGEPRRASTSLVYDIQDIGARFYTYISTLGLVMEAAKEKGIPVFVLDRPNPIGGLAVSGPVRDPEFESFIAHHALPVRHGMTVGELARLFNGERKIGADLHVIPCEGWRREDLYDRTGLLWVNPSPNMRSLTEALLYPGVGLLEATNLATGRGTDTPFERVGAPGSTPAPSPRRSTAWACGGVRFVPIRFTPEGTPVRRQGVRRRLHRHHRPRSPRAGLARDRHGERPPREVSATSGSPRASSGCSPTRRPTRP